MHIRGPHKTNIHSYENLHHKITYNKWEFAQIFVASYVSLQIIIFSLLLLNLLISIMLFQNHPWTCCSMPCVIECPPWISNYHDIVLCNTGISHWIVTRHGNLQRIHYFQRKTHKNSSLLWFVQIRWEIILVYIGGGCHGTCPDANILQIKYFCVEVKLA